MRRNPRTGNLASQSRSIKFGLPLHEGIFEVANPVIVKRCHRLHPPRIDNGLILKAFGEKAAHACVLFSILVVIAVLSICSELFMRIRVTKRETGDKIAWWRRGGDDVADACQTTS